MGSVGFLVGFFLWFGDLWKFLFGVCFFFLRRHKLRWICCEVVNYGVQLLPSDSGG